MKIKKHVRRGSLAALIALALTSSALAMPTGGVVQSGDVNIGGSTDFSTVTDNATITAGTDSTINWNTFNIASGETLNFNIADGKLLLNQVTGAQASDILGTMNQTGKGSLALVNPNGIHIGQNAVLDVNSLTLSTLGIGTKNDAETLLRQGALGARAITVDQGAQFDIARKLNLFGGQVAVADGVVFNLNNVPDPRESMLEVVAAKELYWQQGSDHDSDLSKWTMERGNTVDFHGTVNALSTGKDAEINIMGYAVNADRAHIDGDRAEIAIAAWTKLVSDDRNNAPVKTTKVELSPENVVRADGLHIREKKSTEIRGGKVELKNSTIDTARLDITAQKSFDSAGDMDVTRGHEALTATADNSVALDNVTINGITGPERYHWFEITGGAVNIANANIHTEKTLHIGAISSLDRTLKKREWASPIEYEGTRTSTAANTLNVTNSTLKVTRPTWESNPYVVQADLNAKDVKLTGGTVHLTGATIETPLLAQIMAGTTTEGEDTPYDQTAHTPSTTELHSLQSTPAHTVTIDGTSMIRSTDVAVGGGKVTVGNDVTFHLGDGSGGAMELVAGSRVLSGDTKITTSAAGNEVQFHGKIRGVGMKNQDVDIEGQAVNLDHADIRDVGTVHGVAMKRLIYTRDGHSKVYTGMGNPLSADGMTVEAKEINLMGGQMTLKNATITAEKGALQAGTIELADDKTKMSRGGVIYLDNTKVTMNHTPDAFVAVGGTMNLVNGSEVKTPVGSAVFMLGQSYNGYEDKLNVTKDNKLSLWNSKIEAHDLIDISAGGIGVWQGSEVNAGNELRVDMASADTIRTDGSTGTLLRDAASHVTEAGAEVTEFTVQEAEPVPQPPTLPTETLLSEQDQENIETGKLKAQDALVEPTQEKRAEALAKTVAQLNEKVGTSRRQTAGIVVGIVQEIANASTLSDGEKVALVERVLNAYAPVQEAKAEQDNTATNTHNEAVNAAANVSVAPVYPDETEAEDAITFA
ncbi:MAG: filamentous hemagglutinin N-terminal domain-containing protein [Selenomonas sp.]|nr:filamentous hemagglutinin N-terminal domain-containing protein [Selenomonas sp.]